MEELSEKEQRIRKITQMYYSMPEIQKAIFEFSKNREIAPRYYETLGKRPSTFNYKGDIFEFVKSGATSFHCSQELWENPLDLQTGSNEQEMNKLRTGWDLILDIDCKWFDYAKMAAVAIIETLEDYQVKNVGVKFSGSKGWHILIPWKAFPKRINDKETKDLFPSLPRTLVEFIRFQSEKKLKESLPEEFYKEFAKTNIKRGIKCKRCNQIANSYKLLEIECKYCMRIESKKVAEVEGEYKCPVCKRKMDIGRPQEVYECLLCNSNSKNDKDNFSQTTEVDLYDLIGLDMVVISSRHLFRMPYSLHEKTALSSVVIDKKNISNFQLSDAMALKVNVKNFMPDTKENEARVLVQEALDWKAQKEIQKPEKEEKIRGKFENYKPFKLKVINSDNFAPCIKLILKGLQDGKKRGLFVLINTFRSIGMEKEMIEKEIFDWNNKNTPMLPKAYIESQLKWMYDRKPLMPPNCKEYYQGMGVCFPDNLCNKVKNPVNYIIKKTGFEKNQKKGKIKNKVKEN